ncbi:MAG: methyltransferase domain-containing protein, partial [Ramlibacter sp.]
MTFTSGDRHVYLRAIAQGERTSLSVLASLVTAGARVLDLGTGSGALGQYLRDNANCLVDGITINEPEAALARPNYRRVEVADLEQPGWTSLFEGQQYDFIVCADVLEHLSRPETALRACRPLLAPDGQLLISIPNAAYGGLVAELLEGDFTYRDEGLLDRTHLRFFTRRSLQLFLAAEGWSLDRVEAIDRPVTESEFRGSFDKLPPAVARYLLAIPDASTYQLIAAARPLSRAGTAQADSGPQQPAAALYSVQLYLGDASGFQESRKLVKTGTMGLARQLLRFVLPGQPLTALRLDPADRPGFLHLHALRLVADDQVVWQWSYEEDGLSALGATDHQDMVIHAPWTATAALILLHGEDPRILLPIPAEALASVAANGGAFEVELGWPMSADYLALAGVVEPLHEQLRTMRTRSHEDAVDAQRRLDDAVQQAARHAAQAAGQARLQIEELNTSRREVMEKARLLEEHNLAVVGKNKALSEEKNLIARHRLALQSNLTELAQQHRALAEHLHWIENSTVFRATRPLVRAKMGLERLLGRRAPEAAAGVQARPMLPPDAAVDIIVPVYRGLSDTQLCINSVLASRCQTPWRLVILNDASPEPEVTHWLREISATDSRILLLENEENLGFVGTVNRGMSSSSLNDALLLNSDTEVANDWLDRLRQAAYCDARVASVTPFSNNATICSYPRFCEPNDLPAGCDTAGLDKLFAQTNAGQVIDVPTGVGFCMYIRRDCLNEIGLFDVEQFGKGYGEENDFCR